MSRKSKFEKGEEVKCLMHNDTGIYTVFEVLRNELVVGYDYEDHTGKVSCRFKCKKSLFEVIENE